MVAVPQSYGVSARAWVAHLPFPSLCYGAHPFLSVHCQLHSQHTTPHMAVHMSAHNPNVCFNVCFVCS